MQVRARETLLVLLGSVVLAIPASILLLLLLDDVASYWADVIWGYAFCGLLASGLVLLARRWQVDLEKVFGPIPDGRRFGRAMLAAVPLVLLSIGTFYLVYLPISFSAPAVAEWALQSEDLILSDPDGHPVFANLASFILMVVIVPVVEELCFRGFLCRRLARKWGTTLGIVTSSAIFALLHVDFVGGFAFGAFVAVLYLDSGRLWLPISVHGANNLLAWLAEGALLISGLELETDLDGFRRQWWLGAAGLAIGLPWLVRYLRRSWPRTESIPPVALDVGA